MSSAFRWGKALRLSSLGALMALLGNCTGGGGTATDPVPTVTDVYAGGSDSGSGPNLAVLWRNGVRSVLSTTNLNAAIDGLAVSNGDVYAVGYQKSATGDFNTGVLWKNGAMTTLTAPGRPGFAKAVVVVRR